MKVLFTAPFLLISSLIYGQSDTCLTTLELGISFPPVADAEQRNFAKEHLDTLQVKKIRFAEDWSNREPEPGLYNWAPLDERINWCDENGYELLLTIQSNGPEWACSEIANERSCVFENNAYFETYIDSLFKRYSNKISKIQFGNEWQAEFWYAGSAADFVTVNNILYQSAQIHSPETEVVLGGFTTISLRFLAGCNGWVSDFYDDEGEHYDAAFLAENCTSPEIVSVKNRIDSVLKYAQYDLLDIHLYDDVEQWDEYYFNFTDTISKPVIVTEFGGPNMNTEPYSDYYQAERLYEYIKKLDSLEITEAYYFKLVEGTANPAHSTSGLIDDADLQEKPAYSIFKSFTYCNNFIGEVDMPDQLKIYPNPMDDYAVIELPNNGDTVTGIHIYSAFGQYIEERIVATNQPYYVFQRENLAAGTYIIELVSSSNTSLRKFQLIIL